MPKKLSHRQSRRQRLAAQKPTPPSTPAERLAAAADRHGLTCKDAARFPDVLADAELTPADICKEVIDEAHMVHRARINRLRRLIDERARKLELVVSKKGVSEPSYDEKPAKVAKAKPAASQRVKLFGHSVTAVMRWMGATGGWDADKASKAITKLTGVKPSDATIKIQLKAGAAGQSDRGEPALITPKEAKQLKAAVK